MSTLVPLLNTLLPVLYALTVVSYARIYALRGARDGRLGRVFVQAAVLVHASLVAARGVTEGHLPLAGLFDFLSATGLSITLVYLALDRAEYAAELEALDRLSDSTAAVRLVPDLARAFTLNANVEEDRKSTRLNSSHIQKSRMPSSA